MADIVLIAKLENSKVEGVNLDRGIVFTIKTTQSLKTLKVMKEI